MANGQKAGVARATAAQVQEEQERQLTQLTAIRDAAVRIAGRVAGGYRGNGGELDDFLRRHDLPRNGAVPQPGKVNPAHLNEEGLAHHLTELQASHQAKLESISRDARRYHDQGAFGADTLAEFYEATGIEPPRSVNQVTLGGTVRWNVDGEVNQRELQDKLAEALNEVAGQEVDVTGATMSVRRTFA